MHEPIVYVDRSRVRPGRLQEEPLVQQLQAKAAALGGGSVSVNEPHKGAHRFT